MGAARSLRSDIPAAELRRLARLEVDGRVACRLLALANVMEGMSRSAAARQAGMDRQTLRDRVLRLNASGVEGLRDRPRCGRPCALTKEQRVALEAMVLAGPDPERDGVSSWTAKDLCRLVGDRFAVTYRESGMLRLLHELGLSWQKTRPVHPKADRAAQEAFKKDFPRRLAEVAAAVPEAKNIEIWFQDEARIGQTGRNCRRWFTKGQRPCGRRDLRHEAVYLFGAVCPARDLGTALLLPTVDTAGMQIMLDELSLVVAPDAHALVIMDGAGWHKAADLVRPANLTPIFLPPYSPELNAAERLWLFMRERFLSHRLWPTYDDILDACQVAWNAVRNEAGRIKSLCAYGWADQVKT